MKTTELGNDELVEKFHVFTRHHVCLTAQKTVLKELHRALKPEQHFLYMEEEPSNSDVAFCTFYFSISYPVDDFVYDYAEILRKDTRSTPNERQIVLEAIKAKIAGVDRFDLYTKVMEDSFKQQLFFDDDIHDSIEEFIESEKDNPLRCGSFWLSFPDGELLQVVNGRTLQPI